MKKYVCILVTLIVMITGCSKISETESIPQGEWTLIDVIDHDLTTEETERFFIAVMDMEEEEYEPITILAEQLVSGMNYAYLVQGQSDLEIITIYESWSKEVQFINQSTIDLNHMQTIASKNTDNLVGGWHINEERETIITDEKASLAFQLINQSNTFSYAILLADQKENDAYRFLCCANATLYIVDIIQSSNGKYQIVNQEFFDLLSYINSTY